MVLKKRLIAIVLLTLFAFPTPCFAQSNNGFVGVFADPAGTVPCTTVPPFTGTTLYVLAVTTGMSAEGIVGAEFRIEVTEPANWLFNYIPPVGSLALGTLIDTTPGSDVDNAGLNIAFPTCQSPSSAGIVSMGAISVFNAGGAPTTLLVKRHTNPSNANYPCPLFTRCDAPTYSSLCMTPGSGEPCALGVPKADLHVWSNDPVVFAAGLNAPPPPPGPDPAAGATVVSEVVRGPTLIGDPGPPDIISTGPTKATSSVTADTTWIANWSFDGAGCNASGWTTVDGRDRNDGMHFWSAQSGYHGVGYVVGKAAVLRGSGECWVRAGYGNGWDQALRINYQGLGSTLSFDYVVDCDDEDGMTIEVDYGCDSANNMDPALRPEQLRVRLPDGAFFANGSAVFDAITVGIEPTDSQGSLPPAAVAGCWYIRFNSNHRSSDEDGQYVSSAPLGIGLLIDNIVVTGGLNYSENFEGQSWNANIVPINSAPELPAGSGAPWGRLVSHATDNDKCSENITCAWVFSDPLRSAFDPSMNFGPDGAVIRNWLDETLVSPWISLPAGGGTVLSFREFPGNPFQVGRIMRSLSVRGRPAGSTCATPWTNEANAGGGTWQELGTFQWVDRVEDMSVFVDDEWDMLQVRFRIADWQYLFHQSPPFPMLNTGPGPFVDRIRIGRTTLTGPVISEGYDSRSQAQDTFTHVSSPHAYFPCQFSASGNNGRLLQNFSASYRPPDSIYVAIQDRRGSAITRRLWYGAIVAGPHAGKAPAPYTVNNGFFEVTATQCRYPDGSIVDGMYFVDLDDDYFYGGDVLRYFWYAEDEGQGATSDPPGIPRIDGPPPSVSEAELLTGGLLEVNFLPTITWSPSYLARVAAHPNGDVHPTGQEILDSEQTHCILYVNKVNSRRRSADRTSFMFTLDRIGYSGKYDVYDIQGFGAVANDLVARAWEHLAGEYSLIIHDAGKLRTEALPSFMDTTTVFSLDIDQASWYQKWLEVYFDFGVHAVHSLWLIGENIATTTDQSHRLLQLTGAHSMQGTVGGNVDLLSGAGAARFIQPQGYTDPISFHALPDVPLEVWCPQGQDYDVLLDPPAGAPGPGYVSEYATTHKFALGSSTNLGRAVVMANHIYSGFNRFNTVFMSFPWSDTASPLSGPSPNDALASTILVNTVGYLCAPAGAPTNVDLPSGPTSTLVTRLHPVFPNPANPSVAIAFDLATRGRAQVHIFDVTGRLVRSLVDGELEPGAHKVTWDGRNASGADVAAGVYVCRFAAASVSQTRKLVIVR